MRKVFAAIESPEFAARVSIESSLTRVVRNLTSQSEVKQLFDGIKKKSFFAEDLLKRIVKIGKQSIDPRYENPLDIALTAYLWVLVGLDPQLASVAGETVLSIPGCWWAYKLASKVIQGRTFKAPISADAVKYVHLHKPTGNRAKVNFLVSGFVQNGLLRHAGSAMIKPTSAVASDDSDSESDTEHDHPLVGKSNSPQTVRKVKGD